MAWGHFSNFCIKGGIIRNCHSEEMELLLESSFQEMGAKVYKSNRHCVKAEFSKE